MTEQTAQTTGTEETNSQANQEKPKEFTAITSQEDFDKAIQARIAREQAKFADYDEKAAAAAELAQLKEANKTEAEKTTERLAAAEKRASELETRAARAEVAAAKGIPVELLANASGTQEQLEAFAESLIKFKGEQSPQRMVVPGEGTQVVIAGSPAQQFADHINSQRGS